MIVQNTFRFISYTARFYCFLLLLPHVKKYILFLRYQSLKHTLDIGHIEGLSQLHFLEI